MKTPDAPPGVSDGLYTAQEPDGRVKFVMARRGKPAAHIVLPAEQASELAANALNGAYIAYEHASAGLVPPSQKTSSTGPVVRITGLAIASCPIEGHVCLVVKVGATEIGLAFPKERMRELGKRLIELDGSG